MCSSDLNTSNQTTFSLTVRQRPSITSFAANSVCPSSSRTTVLSVVAQGYQLKYEWFKLPSTTPINGATLATLALDTVGSNDAADYRVRVSSTFCTHSQYVVEADAHLTVYTPASLATATLSVSTASGAAQGTSMNVTAPANQSLVFSLAGATGNPAPTYKWYKGSAEITGATLSSYTIANLTAANRGTYTCEVHNDCATVTTRDIVVGVEDAGEQCYSVGSMPHTAASADLNGDGFNDVVVSNQASGTVSVLFSNRGLLELNQTLSLSKIGRAHV